MTEDQYVMHDVEGSNRESNGKVGVCFFWSHVESFCTQECFVFLLVVLMGIDCLHLASGCCLFSYSSDFSGLIHVTFCCINSWWQVFLNRLHGDAWPCGKLFVIYSLDPRWWGRAKATLMDILDEFSVRTSVVELCCTMKRRMVNMNISVVIICRWRYLPQFVAEVSWARQDVFIWVINVALVVLED